MGIYKNVFSVGAFRVDKNLYKTLMVETANAI
jgi:hypothetical protein